mmetsp:Transcript_73904/g.210896  ORF Transcript_73904/g.210896 Transcript_73904/m.210896 type:complete len:380 (+) Transcript_73904:99-1238(+)
MRTAMLRPTSLPTAVRATLRRSFTSMDYWRSDTTATSARPAPGERQPFAYLRSADRCAMLYSPEEALARLKERLPPAASQGQFRAFFSSVIGGITTCPSLMSVPVDDHMVHRGHAVFDTANVKDGMCYGLNFHLDRILKSAEACRIEKPPSKGTGCLQDVATLPSALGVGTVVASFMLWSTTNPPRRPAEMLATAKTTNYLLNAMLSMEAEDHGGKLGIGFDEATGLITESSIACVGFLGPDGVFRCPRFETILESTTLRRGLELIDEQCSASGGGIAGVSHAELTDVTIDHLREAVEVIFFGGHSATPITEIMTDRASGMEPVGSGSVGSLCAFLVEAFEADMRGAHYTDNYLDEVPYGLYEELIKTKKARSAGRLDQ